MSPKIHSAFFVVKKFTRNALKKFSTWTIWKKPVNVRLSITFLCLAFGPPQYKKKHNGTKGPHHPLFGFHSKNKFWKFSQKEETMGFPFLLDKKKNNFSFCSLELSRKINAFQESPQNFKFDSSISFTKKIVFFTGFYYFKVLSRKNIFQFLGCFIVRQKNIKIGKRIGITGIN